MEIILPTKRKYDEYVNANQVRVDWNKFIRDVCKVHLDLDQQKIIESVQFNPRTTVRSGTSRGKDFAAAWACFCFFAFTPEFEYDNHNKPYISRNTKVAMTAPTDRQIKNIMFPEITKIYSTVLRNAHEIITPMGMRLTGYDIRTRWEDWFLTGFKADNNNKEAWSGFHAANVMFAITEASGMHESIFDTIEGNLQGNSRILLVFNPNVSIGYAARSTKKDDWEKFKLNSLDSPNIKAKKIVIPGQVDYIWLKHKIKHMTTPIEKDQVLIEKNDFEFEGKYYRPNDWFRVKVLGEFPETAANVLIPMQWVEAANERWDRFIKEKRVKRGFLRLGTDVAGMGDDDTVHCHRWGDFVEKFKNYNAGGVANHMETAGYVKNALKDAGYGSASLVDTIGEGAGVFSRLEELFQNTYSVKSNNKADGLSDETGVYEFPEMRDYLYWCVRDWLNPVNGHFACLPHNPRLLEELCEHKYGLDSRGRIKVEAKDKVAERLKRSPDHSDSLTTSFYPESKINLTIDMTQHIEGMW